ncbi:hypothetical protein PIB30_069678 [Stylosanthes scabra]|uniref:Uncharacterized protein n=1 Tax=Stylosanthes scabra TaxID=79078 RepID=A0ABU6TPT2_9FABA|nr:hypothetical protein [Stylosanthes scabra]
MEGFHMGLHYFQSPTRRSPSSRPAVSPLSLPSAHHSHHRTPLLVTAVASLLLRLGVQTARLPSVAVFRVQTPHLTSLTVTAVPLLRLSLLLDPLRLCVVPLPPPAPSPVSASAFEALLSALPATRRRGDNSPLHRPWVAAPSETTLLAAPPRPSSLRRMSVHISHDKLAQAHCATSPLRRPAVSRSPVAVNCSLFAALTRPSTSKSASL